MKNHVKVDGKLLQTNKKYSQLKVSQKEKIAEWLFQETNAYYACNGIYPAGEQLYEIADAAELYTELIAVATRYAAIRAGWQQLSREEKMDRDPSRTSCHDSVITHFNMLSRYFKLHPLSSVLF